MEKRVVGNFPDLFNRFEEATGSVLNPTEKQLYQWGFETIHRFNKVYRGERDPNLQQAVRLFVHLRKFIDIQFYEISTELIHELAEQTNSGNAKVAG